MKLKFKKTVVDYSVGDTAAARKKKPSTSIRSGTYDLVVTSSDALPLSYMRLVGAKVTNCGINWVHVTNILHAAWTRILICDRNVMANSRPGIYGTGQN